MVNRRPPWGKAESGKRNFFTTKYTKHTKKQHENDLPHPGLLPPSASTQADAGPERGSLRTASRTSAWQPHLGLATLRRESRAGLADFTLRPGTGKIVLDKRNTQVHKQIP